MHIKDIILPILSLVLLSSCSNGVVSWEPDPVTDTSDIVITADASKGNRGLYNYKEKVYVYLGVITDLDPKPGMWKYIKFGWGSRVPESIATPVGKNKWSYSIHNIRQFFEVPGDEKILNIALVFTTGCKDSCAVLINKDGSDIFIPVIDTSP